MMNNFIIYDIPETLIHPDRMYNIKASFKDLSSKNKPKIFFL